MPAVSISMRTDRNLLRSFTPGVPPISNDARLNGSQEYAVASRESDATLSMRLPSRLRRRLQTTAKAETATLGAEMRVARPEGFEPPTPRFVVWCSIQLSYGRVVRDAQGRC